MKKRLVFIRHGQTISNTMGRIHKQGTVEPLDQLGKAQSKKLVTDCAKNKVTAIFASPEIRTTETAQIIAEGLHIKKLETLNTLRERNWGEWEANFGAKFSRAWIKCH